MAISSYSAVEDRHRPCHHPNWPVLAPSARQNPIQQRLRWCGPDRSRRRSLALCWNEKLLRAVWSMRVSEREFLRWVNSCTDGNIILHVSWKLLGTFSLHVQPQTCDSSRISRETIPMLPSYFGDPSSRHTFMTTRDKTYSPNSYTPRIASLLP